MRKSWICSSGYARLFAEKLCFSGPFGFSIAAMPPLFHGNRKPAAQPRDLKRQLSEK
jgi:hypothetical protein